MSLAETHDSASSAPKTFSRFGGLWIDRSDWEAILAVKLEDKEISREVADRIRTFVRDGYLVIEQAVSKKLTSAIRAELQEFWRNPPDDARVETFDNGNGMEIIKPDLKYRPGVTKLLDYHGWSQNARKAIAAPEVVAFLSAIFGTVPKAFQTLTFWKGSQQAMHKDTAYVQIDGAPMHLAATWLALEDISPGTGELEYFVGSHRAPDFLFGGEHKWLMHAPAEHDDFLRSHHEDAKTYGYERASFLAKEGDVLIWHADLAHGGSAITNPDATRQSLVTHLTTWNDNPPYQFHAKRVPAEQNGMIFIAQHKQI
ncbi:MAG: hypothetical protein NVSMB18_17270 [Acetobacteraceae bacterium]